MLRFTVFSLSLLALLTPTWAQNVNKLEAPLPQFQEAPTLSKTLLDFSGQTHLNIVADTTNNQPNTEFDLTPFWPKTKIAGTVLNKQSLTFGFFWNQTDDNTLLVWPKPNVKSLATSVVNAWGGQKQNFSLSPEVQQYITSVAQKVDEQGGKAKRDQELTAQLRWSDLPPQGRTFLTPLILQARRERVLTLNRYWLQDEFWDRTAIGNMRFNGEDTWTIGGEVSKQKNANGTDSSLMSHGLTPNQRSYLALASPKQALISDAENEQLGPRWQGDVPPSLNQPVDIKVENAPVVDALTQIAQKCAVSLQLDEKTRAQINAKRLTLDASGMTGTTLLRDIALLFDLKWTIANNVGIASFNDAPLQNTAAKIACAPCLRTWEDRLMVTRPDFASLLSQETTVAQARKKGLPFKNLSSDLQTSLRAFNEDMEIYSILRTWQKTLEPFPEDLKLSWHLFNTHLSRNSTPLPEEQLTPQERGNPQIMAQYNATFYEVRRPFEVLILASDNPADEIIDATYQFAPGILIPQTPEGEKAP